MENKYVTDIQNKKISHMSCSIILKIIREINLTCQITIRCKLKKKKARVMFNYIKDNQWLKACMSKYILNWKGLILYYYKAYKLSFVWLQNPLKFLKLMKINFLQMVYYDVATKQLLLMLAWAARTQAHLSQIMM